MKSWSGIPTAMVSLDTDTEKYRGTAFPVDSLIDLDRFANSVGLPVVWGLPAQAPSELVSGINSHGASDVALFLANDAKHGVNHCALARAESSGGGLDRYTPAEFCRTAPRNSATVVVPHRGTRGRWVFPISIRLFPRGQLLPWWGRSAARRIVPRLARDSHWVMVHIELGHRRDSSAVRNVLEDLAGIFVREGLECVSVRTFIERESVQSSSRPAQSILRPAA